MCTSTKYPYSPMEGFPPPHKISVKLHILLLKFWLLRPSLPLGFHNTFHGVGLDFFWNYANIYLQSFPLQRVNVNTYIFSSILHSNNNLLLTEREGRTGGYWPEVVAVRTERSEVHTKTTEGQYSPVRSRASEVSK